jgi:hypothetical protein
MREPMFGAIEQLANLRVGQRIDCKEVHEAVR